MYSGKALDNDGSASQVPRLQGCMLPAAPFSIVLVSNNNPRSSLGLQEEATICKFNKIGISILELVMFQSFPPNKNYPLSNPVHCPHMQEHTHKPKEELICVAVMAVNDIESPCQSSDPYMQHTVYTLSLKLL